MPKKTYVYVARWLTEEEAEAAREDGVRNDSGADLAGMASMIVASSPSVLKKKFLQACVDAEVETAELTGGDSTVKSIRDLKMDANTSGPDKSFWTAFTHDEDVVAWAVVNRMEVL